MTAHRASQLVEAGFWLQATGDREGARRLFEQALELDPTNARALQFLGGKSPPAVPSAPETSAPLDPHIPTGTLTFGASENPFARPSGAPPSPVRMLAGILQLENVVSPPPAPLGREGAPSFPPAESAWDAGGARAVKVDTSGPRDNDAFAFVAKVHTPPPFQSPGLVSGVSAGEEARTLLRGAEDLIDLDDHSGALDLVNKALELQPRNAQAEALRQKAERTLLAMYESKIGRLDARPQILLKQDEIIWLNLDHRAGFVLAQIDGQVTYDDLFAICGMTRLDTARILAQLLDEGVIAARK